MSERIHELSFTDGQKQLLSEAKASGRIAELDKCAEHAREMASRGREFWGFIPHHELVKDPEYQYYEEMRRQILSGKVNWC